MIEFLKNNITWIKDLVTLILAATATIIGILTYKRARATILQPIRSEVIKKQSELLSRLLQFLKDNNQSFEIGIDYINIVQINVISALRDYGFVFKSQDEIFTRLKSEIIVWIPCGKSRILKNVEIIGTFNSEHKDSKIIDFGIEKFENLKKGIIDIDKIYQTKKFVDFMKIITDLTNDPFMPTSIQNTLHELINTINVNITNILKTELEKFILDFSKKYFDKGTAPNFDPIGVYNDFNHSRIHHRESVIKLRNEIRKYLLVDEPW